MAACLGKQFEVGKGHGPVGLGMAMGRVWTRKVYPWIHDYQYQLISIPESYPNILSMDIYTLPET